jgi:hypothetical protein
MTDIIEDGTGKGYKAKVDANNKLHTLSVAESEMGFISREKGKAYQAHFKHQLSLATTYEPIGLIEYTGEHSLVIEAVTCSKEDAALVQSNGQAFFEVSLGTTRSSGGTVVTPFALNSSSNNELSATVYSGIPTSIVIDETNKKKLLDIACQDQSAIYDFKGAVILRKGDTLTITGKSKNANDYLHTSIFIYEVEEA